MALIKALNGASGGTASPITARDKVNGNGTSDEVSTTEKAGFLVLKSTACGIRNQSASDITILIVQVNSDETNTSKIVVPAESVEITTGLFNAVKVAGSTGHAAETTEYLLA